LGSPQSEKVTTLPLDDLIKRGVVKRMADLPPLEFLSWGLVTLDESFGGIPRGRITVIYGPPDTGKTSLVLNALAANPEAEAIWIDCEKRLQAPWVQAWGVNPDRIGIVESVETIEAAADVVYEAATVNPPVSLIVIDGPTALVSHHDAGRSMLEPTSYAHVPKALNALIRRVTHIIAKAKIALVIIQQTYRDPQTGAYVLPGGHAQRFNSSLILQVRLAQGGYAIKAKEDDAEVVRGVVVEWRCDRCKYMPAMGRKGMYAIYFADVPDPEDKESVMRAPFITDAVMLMRLFEKRRLLTKSGSWYNLLGKKCQGESSVLVLIHKYYQDIRRLLETGELPPWAEEHA